jgi:hypothetical protein
MPVGMIALISVKEVRLIFFFSVSRAWKGYLSTAPARTCCCRRPRAGRIAPDPPRWGRGLALGAATLPKRQGIS